MQIMIQKMAQDGDVTVRYAAIKSVSTALSRSTFAQATVMVTQMQLFQYCQQSIEITKDSKLVYNILETTEFALATAKDTMIDAGENQIFQRAQACDVEQTLQALADPNGPGTAQIKSIAQRIIDQYLQQEEPQIQEIVEEE